MANKKLKPKTTRGQSAKRQLSSSPSPAKKTAKANIAVNSKNTSRKPRTPAALKAKKTTKSTKAAKTLKTSKINSKAAVKKTAKPKAAKRARQVNLRIWLGRNNHLVLTLKLAKLASKPPRTKKTQNQSKFRKILSRRSVRLGLKKHQSRVYIALLAAGLLSSIYFAQQVYASLSLAPAPPAAITAEIAEPPIKKTKTLPASNAVKLSAPDIGLKTEVQLVGKDADGSIEVPKDYHKAGQYKLGPAPGELGPSIIVGHVDNIHGPAVFWRLHQLKPKQVIYVQRQDGTTAKFRVDKVENYPQNAFPAEKVYGNLDYAGLRLITCGGTFNVLKQRYSDNTVVFASLI